MTKGTAAVKYETKGEASVTRESKQVVVDRALDDIYKARGMVTPALVLAEAKDKKSPLHGYFEWDDKTAGDKYRMEQAYRLIQTSKFVVYLTESKAPPAAAGKGTEVRRLVSAFRGESKFLMRNEALADADSRQVIVERKLGELRGWLRGTVDLDELKAVREGIAKLLDSI